MTASSLRSIAPLLVAAFAVSLQAQSVPPALESPAARPPVTGSNGEKLIGMPKFHDHAPYDIDEHTGYKQIFDGKSFTGCDADGHHLARGRRPDDRRNPRRQTQRQ